MATTDTTTADESHRKEVKEALDVCNNRALFESAARQLMQDYPGTSLPEVQQQLQQVCTNIRGEAKSLGIH